jgi:hypothetical protein
LSERIIKPKIAAQEQESANYQNQHTPTRKDFHRQFENSFKNYPKNT